MIPDSGFRLLFESLSGRYLVVLPDDPVFTIAAVTEGYLTVTTTRREEITGRGLFTVFPENPGRTAAGGVENLRASLRRVMLTRAPDTMPVQRYDVQRPAATGGGFEERYWRVVNTPVFDRHGALQYVVHEVDDVTEFVRLERAAGAARGRAVNVARLKQISVDAALVSTLVENSPEYVAIADAGGALLHLNPAASALTGDEIAGDGPSSVLSHFVPEQREFLRHVVLPAAWERGEWQGELHFRHLRTLETRPVLCTVFRIGAEGAERPGHFAVIARDVREGRSAEAELRESERRFRSVFNQQFQFIALLSPDGTVLEINELPLQVTGFTREQMVGRLFWETPFWTDLPVMRDSWQVRLEQASRADGPVLTEDQFQTAAGETRVADAAVTALKDSHGRVEFFLIQASDITGRKRLQEALAERERRYHMLLTSMDEGFCICEMIWDANGRPADYRFLDLNPWFEKATGLSRELALSGTAREIVPGLEDEWVERYGAVVLTGEPDRFESYSAAMRRYFSVYALAVGGDQFALIFTEITERKAAENERERLVRQLEAERRRLQQVLTQAPVAVAVLRGRELRFELANHHYEQFFPDRQLAGRPLIEAVPEVSPAILEILHGVLDSGEPFARTEFLIPLDRDGDGVPEDYWFTFVYHPLQEIDGSISGVLAIGIDVSSHVRARLELERVNRELEEFAYVASHDLQEPLRTVNTFTELLLRRTRVGEDPEARDFASFIRQGVTRMEDLIRDLLSYSRAIHTDSPATGQADLAKSLSEAVQMLRVRIDETGAEIHTGRLPIVRGDETQFALVFQNLLSNSLKYRRPETAPEIWIDAEESADHWRVSLRDNGIGFEQRYAQRIFKLFKRLHKQDYPGTGLGLAICQRILERSGGRMWAEGRPGEGSTFYFSVPKAERR